MDFSDTFFPDLCGLVRSTGEAFRTARDHQILILVDRLINRTKGIPLLYRLVAFLFPRQSKIKRNLIGNSAKFTKSSLYRTVESANLVVFVTIRPL